MSRRNRKQASSYQYRMYMVEIPVKPDSIWGFRFYRKGTEPPEGVQEHVERMCTDVDLPKPSVTRIKNFRCTQKAFERKSRRLVRDAEFVCKNYFPTEGNNP